MTGTGWRRGAAAAAAALLAGALGWYVTSPAPASPTSVLAVPSATAAAPARTSTPSTTPRSASTAATAVPVGPARRSATLIPARAGSVPTRIVVPRLDIDARVVPVGLEGDGLVAVPTDIRTAGWYRFGARPGQGEGPTVVVAHADSRSQGVGPFADIGSLRTGDRITVTAGGASVRYRVTTVAKIAKRGLDTRLLFAADGPERLHLVTCGGEFDERVRSYEDNVVVVATRVSSDGLG